MMTTTNAFDLNDALDYFDERLDRDWNRALDADEKAVLVDPLVLLSEIRTLLASVTSIPGTTSSLPWWAEKTAEHLLVNMHSNAEKKLQEIHDEEDEDEDEDENTD
jgi:hypothetical protein